MCSSWGHKQSDGTEPLSFSVTVMSSHTHTKKQKQFQTENLREGTGNTKAERAKRGYKVTQISVIAELVEPKGRGDVSGNWMLRVGPLQGNAQIPKEGFVGLVLTSLQAAPWLMLNLAKAVLSTE